MTKPLHKGWDVFTPDPGKFDTMSCPVCGQDMVVTRDVEGPRSWVEAMAKVSTKYDEFVCANAQEDWHRQVRCLREKIQDSPSASIDALLEAEIKTILETKKPTKDRYWS